MRPLPILMLAALAACGTPQEQCIRTATRDLRVVQSLIAETQGNLDRGYAWESREITRTRWAICGYDRVVTPEGAVERLRPRYCLDDVTHTIRRRVAIDPAAEQRKLAGLQQKRVELNRRAAAEIEACKARYPEAD